MSDTVLTIAAICTGLVAAGEALALAFGIGILNRRKIEWLNGKNLLLLALDVLAGGVLIWAGFGLGSGGVSRVMLFGSLVILLVTHTYRTWEYLAHQPNPFCFNLALFIVNEIKSTAALIVLVLAIS